MFTLVLISWGWGDQHNIETTWSYKSFKKHHPEYPIKHFHFNRGHHHELERKFNEDFGPESEYLIYKIFNMLQKVNEIETEYFVFTDSTDVYCSSKIDAVKDYYDLNDYLIFGHEKNDWPKPEVRCLWPDYTDYSPYDIQNKNFLNSGVFVGKTANYKKMLEVMVHDVLPKKLHTKNDQGMFLYYMNTLLEPRIKLDLGSFLVLNTYNRNENDFYRKGNKLYYKSENKSPIFVHDSGTPWGGAKLITKFGLHETI
jgi:hypothetical protein